MDDDIADLLSNPVQFRNTVFRNIKTCRESQDLYDDLTDNADDYSLAFETEALTRVPVIQAAIARPYDDVIDYPFENLSLTRFSNGSFGVFYGSLMLNTTIYETVYHWWQFLKDSGYDVHEVLGERRVHLVDVDATLFDCRERHLDYPDIVDPHDYRFTNVVGDYIHETERDGLLTQSARCEGVNTPIFRQDRLSNSRTNCYLTYTLDPINLLVEVEKQIGEVLLEVSLEEFH